MTERPIGIYYEHPDWFRPLFSELDRRGTPYVRVDATSHAYDVTNGDGSQFGLVFNRMSPSAYLRGHGHSILRHQRAVELRGRREACDRVRSVHQARRLPGKGSALMIFGSIC